MPSFLSKGKRVASQTRGEPTWACDCSVCPPRQGYGFDRVVLMGLRCDRLNYTNVGFRLEEHKYSPCCVLVSKCWSVLNCCSQQNSDWRKVKRWLKFQITLGPSFGLARAQGNSGTNCARQYLLIFYLNQTFDSSAL